MVAEVCARLDGVPLAIELAAARSASLGVDGLLAGLDDHLRLLAGSRGAHERHRSLRAVIDWSHDLLDDDERAMFRRVGAFVGGFDLDAAVAVWPGSNRGMVADLVGRLTDKSLLTHRRGPEGSRWQMLETIRAYALDRLAASGEEATVRDAHLRWAASVADDLERQAETGLAVARPPSTRSPTTCGPRWPGPRARTPRRSATGWPARSATWPTRAGSWSSPASTTEVAAARAGRARPRPPRTCAPRPTWPWPAGHGAVAFDLLLAAAEQAGDAGDDSARAAAWPTRPPSPTGSRTSSRGGAARPAAPAGRRGGRAPARPGDPVAAAYVAVAAAWIANPEKTVPDPALSGRGARRGPADRRPGADQRGAGRRGRGAGPRAGGCARRTR